MQHDACVRAAARAIYEVCFPALAAGPAGCHAGFFQGSAPFAALERMPADTAAVLGFDEAERKGTDQYRRALRAAEAARLQFEEEPRML